MAISTNGTVLARLAGALYNTQMSNATYSEVKTLDPAALANTLYARDFGSSTDLAVATTLVTNLGLTSVTGLANWVAAQLTAAGTGNKGAKVVDLLNSFAQMTADTTYGAYATAFNAKVDAALVLSQTTGNAGGTFAAAGTPVNATFALTAGTDVWTGGAGDDTVNATVATLGALDVIDGGAGANTLNLVDTGAVASGWGGATITNMQTVKIAAGGAVGALYAAASGATSAQAAQAQVTKIAVGATDSYLTTNVVTLTVGSASTTFNPTGTTAASLAQDLRDQIRSFLGDYSSGTTTISGGLIDVEIDGSVNTTVNLTSKKAGTVLPAITVSVATSSSSTTAVGTQTITASSTANKFAVGPGAIAEVLNIGMSVTNAGSANAAQDLNAGDPVIVSINGVKYAVASAGTDATAAGAAVASAINSALGTGVAVNNSGVVTVTAPVAGTPLPYINVSVPGATGTSASYTPVVGNQQAASSGTAAVTPSAVTAPTGTTSYTVSATGAANVSGAATTALDVTGTSVQTSGGSSVKVTGTGSVGVKTATGAVTIVTSDAGTGNVETTAGTGATSASYGSGIYVTGGTTVSATQRGGTVSSTDASRTANTNAVKVGVDPTEVTSATLVSGASISGSAKTTATAAFYGTVAGLASDPTGDVTIIASTNYTVPSISGTISNGSAGRSSVVYGTGAQKAFVNGATSVSLTGVGTGTITDVNTQFVNKSATDTVGSAYGTSKLATVNLTGASGTTTIKSDAISTVNVLNATGSARVVASNSGTVGANSGTFNLSVGNSTVRVDNNTATSVNVSSATTSYQTLDGTAPVTNANALTLNAAKATALTFTNASPIALSIGNSGALPLVATITASGAGALDLGSLASSALPKLATVAAGSSTGAITASVGATNALAGLSLTTGSGNDVITVAGNISPTTATVGGGLVTTTINLGAGNDTLLNNSGTVAAGALIDAGDGTDSVALTLVNAGNAAIFKNFERLAISGATEDTSFDSTLLTTSAIAGVNVNGDVVHSSGAYGMTVTNLPGTVVTVDVTASSNAILSATLATSTGTADSESLNFSSNVIAGSNTTVTLAGLKVTGIETVNVSSAGTITNTTDFTTVKLTNALTALTDAGNVTTSIVVTGANAFKLGSFTSGSSYTSGFNGTGLSTATANVVSALKTIDASGNTGGVTIVAGTDTSFTATGPTTRYVKYDGLTITGGTGTDTLVNDAAGGVTLGGDGNDSIFIKGGATTAGVKASADGGAGNDTLTVLTTVSTTLTGGTGNDTFNVAAAKADNNTTPVMTTITDFSAGDSLILASSGVVALVSAQAAIASATTLVGAIAAALSAASGSTSGALVTDTQAGYFTYGGNTYVVLDDNSNGLAASSAAEVIVKLNGIVDLSTATIASNVITL